MPQLVGKFAQPRPGIAITTDIIVGFPWRDRIRLTKQPAISLNSCNSTTVSSSGIRRRRETPAAACSSIERIRKRGAQPRPTGNYQRFRPGARTKDWSAPSRILCEAQARRIPARLMGRTRTNKIVVFRGGRKSYRQKIFDVAIERANGFSLYDNRLIDAMIYHFSLANGRALPGAILCLLGAFGFAMESSAPISCRIFPIPGTGISSASIDLVGASGSSRPVRWRILCFRAHS